jgi:hypothetical protein
LELDATSPGVTQEPYGYLGFEKKLTDDFSVVLKFKKGERASTLEFRKGPGRFNISAGGVQFYVRHMCEKVRICSKEKLGEMTTFNLFASSI